MIPDYLPESFSVFVPLFEFNPCHDPKAGTFTVKGQGRCLGDVARRAARLEYGRAERAARTPAEQEYHGANLEVLGVHRRYLRKTRPRQNLPAFLRPDAERAWQTDRALVDYDPAPRSGGSGIAYPRPRLVHVRPDSRFRGTKAELLTTLRHELGHIDRTPLGRPRLFGQDYGPRYNEEVRAWKNAIRNSGGKVSWANVRRGLMSYAKALDRNANEALGGWGPQSDNFAKGAERHITLLKRYAKRIRRATKADTTETLREDNKCHMPKTGEFAPKGQGVCKKGWHLTADPHFVANPESKPEWNSLAGDLMGDARPAGLFVTDSPEYWMQAHGYERPYVAQVEGRVTNPPGTVMHVGREEFMQGKAKTVRVLTVDEYAREVFGDAGWVEDYFGEAPKIPKGYVGRAVSDMTPAEIAAWEKKFAEYTRRRR